MPSPLGDGNEEGEEEEEGKEEEEGEEGQGVMGVGVGGKESLRFCVWPLKDR